MRLTQERLKIEQEIERAIKFLSKHIETSGTNKKPVVFHSVKVGLYLQRLNSSKDTIISGILHDVLEDSKCTEDELKEVFGEKITSIVKELTLTKDKIKLEGGISVLNIAGLSKEAITIRCADFIHNIPYYKFAETEEKKFQLFTKAKIFVKEASGVMKGDKIYQNVRKTFKLYNPY